MVRDDAGVRGAAGARHGVTGPLCHGITVSRGSLCHGAGCLAMASSVTIVSWKRLGCRTGGGAGHLKRGLCKYI